LKHFEEWLSWKGCSAWGEEWSDHDTKERFFCEAVLFDLFANWFLELPLRFKNPHTGKYEYKARAWQSVQQVLSHVKEAIKAAYPQNELWQEEKWYAKIRNGIETIWKRRAIEKGDCFFEHEPPIGNEEVHNMAAQLLRGSRTTYDGVLRRAYVVTNHYFAGRTAEGAFLSWEHLKWFGPGRTFIVYWPEMKTLELKPYPIVSNPYSFENDFMHSLACAYTVGGGGNHLPRDYDMDSYSVYPQLTPTTTGKILSETISSLAMRFDSMGSLVSGVDGISLDMGPKGFRSGKVAEIIMEPTTDTFHGQMWGGWGEESGNMSKYVKQSLKSGFLSARAGYNYSNPRQRSFLPEPVFMTEINCVAVESYMNELFKAEHVNLITGQHHLVTRRFAAYLLATLVMHLEKFMTKYDREHIVVRRMREAGAGRTVDGRDIDLTLLCEWGRQVRTRYDFDNAIAAADTNDCTPAVIALQKQVQVQQRTIDVLSSDVKEMKVMLQEFMSHATQALSRGHTSPSRRRAVAEDDVSLVTAATTSGGSSGSAEGAAAVAAVASQPSKANAFTTMITANKGGGGQQFVFPLCKKLTVQTMLVEFRTRDLSVSCPRSWTGSRNSASASQQQRRLGSGPTEPSSHDKSRIKKVHEFVFEHIVSTLPPTEQQALGAKQPSKDNHVDHGVWQANLYSAALAAQKATVAYLGAREALKKADEAKTLAAVGSAPATKKAKGRQAGALGPTIHSIVGRIESMEKTDWLKKQLTPQEQEAALTGVKLNNDSAGAQKESEEEEEEEEDGRGFENPFG